MSYTAFYKNPGGFFSRWRKVKKVVGDTIIETEKGQPLPVRVLFLEDKSRLEVPMSCMIKFSRERFLEIQAKMSREAGQKIEV